MTTSNKLFPSLEDTLNQLIVRYCVKTNKQKTANSGFQLPTNYLRCL